jgi:protein-S-isoprenylcysteine O-methyltransferase Ste14
MQATPFEFNHRFWLIGLIIWFGFFLASVDHVNAAIAFLHFVRPSLDPDSARGTFWLRMIFGSGALLVFLAAFLRTWATAYLRADVVHDARIHSEKHVADGAFRYVRNPLYLANILLAAGMGLMASRLGWLFMVLAMTVFMYRLILHEEAGLLAAQGDSFRAYLEAVPRLWPALTTRLPAGDVLPRWGQAIVGEMFFWIFGAAVLVFAVTLRFKPAAILMFASIAIYLLIAYARKKMGRSPTPVQ